MLYSPTQIALIALIMTSGAVVQGAIGFASGLLGVPLLVLSGFSVPEAATINLVSTSVQNFTGTWKLWSHLQPRELIFPVIVRWLGIPLGAYVVWLADTHLAPSQAKQMIGALLLVIVALLWVCRVRPRDHLNLFWQTLAFSASGFMLGFAAMGGAPLVLYVNALTWTAAKSRAFLFFCSTTGLPVAAVIFWLKFGTKILPAALTTLLLLPLIFAGLFLGLRLGHQLPKPLFRKITLGLVILIAIGSIFGPMIADQYAASH